MVYFRKKDIKDMLNARFTNIELFYQPAAIDFIRSSGWRIKEGRGRVIDRLICLSGQKRLKYILLILAFLGFSSRLAVHCRRK
jgi:hypothetical protein